MRKIPWGKSIIQGPFTGSIRSTESHSATSNRCQVEIDRCARSTRPRLFRTWYRHGRTSPMTSFGTVGPLIRNGKENKCLLNLCFVLKSLRQSRTRSSGIDSGRFERRTMPGASSRYLRYWYGSCPKMIGLSETISGHRDTIRDRYLTRTI
jgi:hypothetical protein